MQVFQLRLEQEAEPFTHASVLLTPEIIVTEELRGSHDYSVYGPEWPFNLHEIRARAFDPVRLPEHLRATVFI